MSRRPKLRPLPEAERRQSLEKFLSVLQKDPDLDYFRLIVPPGPERQLALFAALERSAFRGSPTIAPPKADDPIDQLLCDVLDAVEREPGLKNYGSAYGADRHMVNLQALGAWSGQPTATELFTTAFSHLSADGQSTLPACEVNLSPGAQVSGQNGDLIGPETDACEGSGRSLCVTQVIDGTVVVADEANQSPAAEGPESTGIIRHRAENPGDKLLAEQISPHGPGDHPANDAGDAAWGRRLTEVAPVRSVRRGRPAVIDDVAKGRVLGLMSFGLSFRQAAAQLGVHHQTLLNAMKRDEAFAQQVAEARLDAMSQPLLTVVQASRTNWRAAAWLAKFLSDRQARSYESTPEEKKLAEMMRR